MKSLFTLLIALICISLASCSTPDKANKKVKNLILMIGDGMGPQQVSLLYYYAKYGHHPNLNIQNLAFKQLADQGGYGLSTTESFNHISVDSACSATQLSTGKPSLPLFIGMDNTGEKIHTILEKAKAKGLSTGLVSDTRITHATPASFAAHSYHRDSEPLIAQQLLQSQPDVMLSGGVNYFIPKGTTLNFAPGETAQSERKDNLNLLKQAQTLGYSIAHTKSQMNKVSSDTKILGLFSSSGMPSSIWQNNHLDDQNRSIPNLLEMSKVAVTSLAKNDKGFFLMIEGGQIDWASHQNDAGSLLHEMVNFNNTIMWVLEWVKKHPDTLLVVTADHETGGFAFGYNSHNVPGPETIAATNTSIQYQIPYNFGSPKILDKLYQQKEPLVATWGHFKEIPKKQRTAKKLQQLVFKNTGYMLTENEAKAVMANHKNPYFKPHHKKLNDKKIAKVDDFSAFYFGGSFSRSALISRKLSGEMGIIWGTGGHTATPVQVFSYGSTYYEDQFSGFTNHVELGQMLQQALEL